jgi:hypothetical protein
VLFEKMVINYCFSFIILAALASCVAAEHASKYPDDAFIISGIMNYLEVEGGCWQFIDEDGETYEIVGLNVAPLLVNGQKAEIVVREIPGVASICMVGKMVELLEIIQINEE